MPCRNTPGKSVGVRELFAVDPARGERLHAEAAGLYLDYSKQRVTDETLRLLLDLAGACGLNERIAAMLRGDKINTTEDRAVLHTALRAPVGKSILVDGTNIVPDVHAVLDRMAAFCERVRSGAWTGHGGKRIRNGLLQDLHHAGDVDQRACRTRLVPAHSGR